VVHAPAAEVKLNGSSQIFGAVVADSFSHAGGNVAIHYDEALGRGAGGGGYMGPTSIRDLWVSAD
jgi:hypothetical protein